MIPGAFPLTVYRGVDETITLTCYDSTGAVFPLTGWSVRAKFRPLNADSPVTSLSASITNEAGGVVTISLGRVATAAYTLGRYTWDLVLITPTGSVQGPYIQDVLTVAEVTSR